MSYLRSADRALAVCENAIAATTLGAAALVAIVNVMLRYLANESLFWAEEATVYLIIFSTFIGAVITLRKNEHVSMDVTSFFTGRRGKRIVALVSALLVALYCLFLGLYGWLLIISPSSQNTLTPSLDLPLWIVQASVPIGLTLMFIRSLQLVYRAANGRDLPAEEQDTADSGGE